MSVTQEQQDYFKEKLGFGVTPGISLEDIVPWQPNVLYDIGNIVLYNLKLFKCTTPNLNKTPETDYWEEYKPSNVYTKTETDDTFIKNTQKNNANGVVGIDNDGYLSTQKLSTYTEKIIDKENLSGVVNLDLNTGRIFKGTVIGSVTSLTFSNTPSTTQTTVTLYLIMGNSNYSVTFPDSIKWTYRATPILALNKTHELVFKTIDNGQNWFASKVGEY